MFDICSNIFIRSLKKSLLLIVDVIVIKINLH